jgi:hypothetical protein
MLHLYLDEALGDEDSARVEGMLRSSEPLRRFLRVVMSERDRGEHSLGAIWRRHRVSCPAREQLRSFLLKGLDDEWLDYIEFHLEQVECPFCLANLADLKTLQHEEAPKTQARRRKFFESSAGYLHIGKEGR